ncbi:MAG: biotin--[acetyl-CoA-carboxylase] ligase [Euryarchaeota archaeon]|nr:biotin--[acetyl-CoA-carboxylase] ligase [Euryarchaeota archaeon]
MSRASWVPGVWVFEWSDAVTSTNDVAKERARSDAPSGLVVGARRQTGGRGRGGHTWTSPEGGLYCSIVLRDIPPEVAPLLPLATTVALAEAIDRFALLLRVWVKWPNDLLVGAVDAERPEGKAAGVLVESASEGARVTWAVVGLGLDLAVPEVALPATEPPARSLVQYDPDVPHTEQFMATFLDRFGAMLDVAALDPQAIIRLAERRLAYRGEPVVVVVEASENKPARFVEGTLDGLEPDGRLRLDTPAGPVRFAAWEASALRPSAP